MVVRPCLDCQRPTRNGSRCPEHAAAFVRRRSAARGTRQEQGYGNDWLRLSRMVIERDGGVCHYCGAPATTADHVIPKSKGGPSHPSNLVAACRPCNSKRGNRG